ncbi:MAG: hypothetical protein WBQ86_15105 [Candidatus Binatus sp.]
MEKGHPIDTNLNESAVRQDASAVPSPKGGPRHYHLLWDEELEALRPVLRLVLEHLEEVIAYWYQLYVLHFGDKRSLSEPDFREIFYNALSRNTKDLLEGDMDRYSINTIRTGELLCERRAWQMGPAWAFSYRGIPRLQIAGLFKQGTSFAYTSSHSVPVSSLQIQPILSYQLGRGWYLKSSDATGKINYRHKTSTEMPLSVGFGRVWKFGEGYAIDMSMSGEWMVYRQFSTQTEQFALRFGVSLLLPQLSL